MDNRTAVLETIRYSDLFDFPVSEKEIWQYLIANNAMTRGQLTRVLKTMQMKKISYQAPYYCLKGREKIFVLRKRRQIASLEKLEQTQSLLTWFSFIPTLRYVGISGSLARMNAERSDDIDLFIIAEAKTVWITRLFLLGVLQIVGKRRKRAEKNAQDKICLNFLLDTRSLKFSKNRHDIYTAYEIAQLKTIYDRSNSYLQFVQANSWMKKLLPHFSYPKKSFELERNIILRSMSFLCTFLEPIARLFQLWIIQKHRTTEVVNDGLAAFHPHDYRSDILRRLAILASEELSEASKSQPLWDIDKARPIIYTRKDYTISPNIPLERFSFKNL